MQHRSIEIHVFPAQCKQFARTDTRRRSNNPEPVEPMSRIIREESLHFFGAE